MNRTLLLVSLIALAAAPAAAQGKSKEHRRDDRGSQLRDYGRNDDGYRSKTHRTFIDSRGLECREKSEIKKDGRRKYDLKCKEPKHHRSDRRVGLFRTLGAGFRPLPDRRHDRLVQQVF